MRGLNPYLIDLLKINSSDLGRFQTIDPNDLIVPERLDIVAKYIYAKAYLSNDSVSRAKEIYFYHLIGMTNGNFIEGDYSGKKCFDDYLKSFEKIIDSIKRNGFDESESVVPICKKGVAIDGAHRIAACLALGRKVNTIEIDRPNSHNYNWQFFKNSGLDLRYLEQMIFEYVNLIKKVDVFCLWPAANSQYDSIVEEMLRNYGCIIYKKELHLNNNGAKNFVLQAYMNHSWVGSWKDGYAGATGQQQGCFKGNNNLRIYFFQRDNQESTKIAKNEIRNIFKIGNFSVHSTDNHEEAVFLAKNVLNSNTIHFMNNAVPYKFKKFNELFEIYMKKLSETTNSEDFCIDSSAVLSAYGIRDLRDLDFIKMNKIDVEFQNDLIQDHEENLKYYDVEKEDLILNPDNYFYYKGFKFVSITQTIRMKEKRGEDKDRKDVFLIKAYLKETPFFKMRYFLHENYKIIIKFVAKGGYLLRRKDINNAEKLRKIVREIIYYSCLLKNKIKPYLKKIKPFIQTRKYMGYKLFYSKGTSLIERLNNRDDIYEKDVCEYISSQLSKINAPVFVDVGANIGLISLYVCKKVENVKIFAFEPGPHQNMLFNKTILKNKLRKSIELSSFALSDRSGTQSFFVHDTKDSSGDGFKDTLRAGETKEIFVDSIKMDEWWEKKGRIAIDVIKIDVEGAELLVLKGAEKMIHFNKPFMIIEIYDLNHVDYGYDSIDVINYLGDMGYEIYADDGVDVKKDNILEMQKKNIDTYYCKWTGNVGKNN